MCQTVVGALTEPVAILNCLGVVLKLTDSELFRVSN
jgi:hypothetical protein